ncbi:MAG: efflux RND transporter periplasmic adaptor subunit [Nitrospiraceae bacterium]
MFERHRQSLHAPWGLERFALLAVLLLSMSGCTEDAASISNSQSAKKRHAQAHLVESAAVVAQTLSMSSVYTGSLRHRQTVRIYNQEEGRATRIPFYEGDRVKAGDIVLELDAALLIAQLDKAKAVRREAESNLKRVRRLVNEKILSEDESLRAETAFDVAKAEERILETRVGYAKVSAPFSGVVTARLVEPGDILPRHTHVLTLADPSSLVTDLAVSEMLLSHIAVGNTVRTRIDALGDTEFPGQVVRVHPELDPRTRQGRVEIELRPVPRGARAGQFARVTFSTEALDRRVIPFAALRHDRDGEFVYRIDDDRVVHRVQVRSGQRLADKVEVLEGLGLGDLVVVKGFLGLNEGKQVKIVNAPGEGDRRPAPTGSPTSGREGS